MSALGPHSLGAACRTIYDRAAEDNILPALIRNAADPEPPHRRIEASGPGFSIIFNVLYAEPANRAPGRLVEPPLRFDIEARTSDDGVAVELSARERFELIRAFLLGVRQPLVVDAPADGAGWRVAIRLSARFVMWSPDPVRLDDRFSATTICERLAARALESTRALFGSPAEGLEVWEVRLREELFGEPPLSAHDIWPLETSIASPAAADAPTRVTPPPARHAPRARPCTAGRSPPRVRPHAPPA
ncbi:MAG: hypothetical protein KDJ25_15270, partial [Rhodoblastus sp.]|nr:hypothetical protein [Rhodoblastus sp.]